MPVNPVIPPSSGETQLGWEGCLSVPGLRGEVRRWQHIRINWLTEEGEPQGQQVSGFDARVVQQECDHLDGVRFPDRLSDSGAFGFIPELQAAGLIPAVPRLRPGPVFRKRQTGWTVPLSWTVPLRWTVKNCGWDRDQATARHPAPRPASWGCGEVDPAGVDSRAGLAASGLSGTGLAGLEPATYGLGNRPNPLAQLGSGLDLPNHLPQWGSKRPIGSAQKRP